jgi:hypothetical protein
MTKVRLPDSPEALAAAEAAFVQVSVASDLMAAMADDQDAPTIAYGRLYEYAKAGDPARDPQVAKALGEDRSVWEQFRAIAARIGNFGEAAAAAAASTQLSDRDGMGWRIQLKPSKAKPEQTYLVFEWSDLALPPPRTLYVYGADESAPLSCELGEAHEGKIQKVLVEDSDLVRALRDPASKVLPL